MKKEIRVLKYNEWLNILPEITKELYPNLEENYKNYLDLTKKHMEHVNSTNNCNCNICQSAICEYHGYKKYDIYSYRGVIVYISGFCSLQYCKNIFIDNLNGFCEGLSIEEAKELVYLNYSILNKSITQ